MLKKAKVIGGTLVVPVIMLALLGLVYLVTAQEADPEPPPEVDLSAELELAAQLIDGQEYAQAEDFYRDIIDYYPDSDYAIEARGGLVRLVKEYADLGELTRVDDLALVLEAAMPPGDALGAELAETLHGIGGSAEDRSEALAYLQQAERLYRAHVPSWPTDGRAITARRAIIDAFRSLDREAEAVLAEDELMADYACGEGATTLAGQLCLLADRYRRIPGSQVRANVLYRHALDNCPGNDEEMDLWTGLARSGVAMGDYAIVQDAADQLIATQFGRPGFTDRMSVIGRECRRDGNYAMAESIYRYVVENVTADMDADAVLSQSSLVIVLYESGDTEAAAAELDLLIEQFPPEIWTRKSTALSVVAGVYRRARSNETAEKLYRMALDLTPADSGHYPRLKLAHLDTRTGLVLTLDEAEELFQGFRDVIESGPSCSMLVRRAFEGALIGHLRYGARTRRMDLALDAAERLVAAYGPESSPYHQALALKEYAYALSRNGSHEESVDVLLDLVDRYGGQESEAMDRVISTVLAQAYVRTRVHLRRPEQAQAFIDEIRTRWPDGRYESKINHYVTLAGG